LVRKGIRGQTLPVGGCGRLIVRGPCDHANKCIEQQEHIIPLLAVRIKSLEEPEMDGTLCVDDLLIQLRADLAEAESGLEEAREAGLLLAAKTLEWTITQLKARIEALEGTQ
jgi:hypothetical protein